MNELHIFSCSSGLSILIETIYLSILEGLPDGNTPKKIYPSKESKSGLQKDLSAPNLVAVLDLELRKVRSFFKFLIVPLFFL